MGWSYNKLWIMLINRNMKRTDLLKRARINSNALARMGKNEPVAMVALGKICQAMDCNIEDIVEYIREPEICFDETVNSEDIDIQF